MESNSLLDQKIRSKTTSELGDGGSSNGVLQPWAEEDQERCPTTLLE